MLDRQAEQAEQQRLAAHKAEEERRQTETEARVPYTSSAAVPSQLLGQYGNWAAYTAYSDGKKLCFVLANPTSSRTSQPSPERDTAYMFITTRPADRVINEVSIVIGYPLSEATAEVGSDTLALYTQQGSA